MAALIIIFGGWVLDFAFIYVGTLLVNKLGVTEYLAIFAAVLLIATRLINRWIYTKGVKIFEEL